MKTAKSATVAAALVAALLVAWKAPGLVIESPKAQIKDPVALPSSTSEQDRKFIPRVTSLTSTALISRRSSSADSPAKTLLIGRTRVEDMVIQLELEPAKAMPTVTGLPPKLTEHEVGIGELYHVMVAPVDPRSNTRIPYTSVIFHAVNRDNGREVKAELQPMWGRSGLHYAVNSGLAGDGVYESKVIVGVPTFARDPKDPDRWMQPVAAKFHFELTSARLTEGSKPMD
jgi:uncharacterized protein involved in high-affinity Fe2+ transport